MTHQNHPFETEHVEIRQLVMQATSMPDGVLDRSEVDILTALILLARHGQEIAASSRFDPVRMPLRELFQICHQSGLILRDIGWAPGPGWHQILAEAPRLRQAMSLHAAVAARLFVRLDAGAKSQAAILAVCMESILTALSAVCPTPHAAVGFRMHIVRSMLRAEPETLFVFGDNLRREGKGGQAAEMRSEPNAIGIVTKRYPSWNADAFFNNADYGLVYRTNETDFERIAVHLERGGKLVAPSSGIGTGRARLSISAPSIEVMIAERFRGLGIIFPEAAEDRDNVRCYAGIGSRDTPDPVLPIMTQIAEALRRRGWVLRSGGAKGADSAFEAGVRGPDGRIDPKWAQVFLAHDGAEKKFVRNGYLALKATPAMMELVDRYHPNPAALSGYARLLMARNGCQILGPTLDDPVKAVVCWTKGGAGGGGTGQALRIARAHHIPVIDLGGSAWMNASVEAIVTQVERSGPARDSGPKESKHTQGTLLL